MYIYILYIKSQPPAAQLAQNQQQRQTANYVPPKRAPAQLCIYIYIYISLSLSMYKKIREPINLT